MIVNGKEENFQGFSISEMLNKLNLNESKVVVELNLEIIPKENYSRVNLKDKDKIEIVAFVGGG